MLLSAQHSQQEKNTRFGRRTMPMKDEPRDANARRKRGTLSVRKVRALRILRGYISKHDTKITDLNCEVNKARFYEKNQYRLHWTPSPTRPESLQDDYTVFPGMSLHGELCWIHESNVPQFIRNHHCRDGVRGYRQRNN